MNDRILYCYKMNLSKYESGKIPGFTQRLVTKETDKYYWLDKPELRYVKRINKEDVDKLLVSYWNTAFNSNICDATELHYLTFDPKQGVAMTAFENWLRKDFDKAIKEHCMDLKARKERCLGALQAWAQKGTK